MIAHVLDLSDLLHEKEAVPSVDREWVEAVLDALERADECGDRAGKAVLELTATVRALLAPHWRRRADGMCAEWA
jgi:hypothetical protein